jgi:hypothetical protein
VDCEKCIQKFSLKTQRQEATWRGQRHMWKGTVKMDFLTGVRV